MGNADALIYFPCCGNGYCQNCDEDNYKDVSGHLYIGNDPRPISKCPMCRTKLTHTDAQQDIEVERLAQRGKAWAQHQLGRWHLRGLHGKQRNMNEALKWLQLASDQQFPAAMDKLADMYEEGSGVERDLSKAKSLWLKASNLGCSEASMSMVKYHNYSGEEAVYFATLAYSQDKSSMAAAHVLGKVFYYGEDGLEQSLFRAKHYFQVAADAGNQDAYKHLACTLFQLSQSQYKTPFGIPGHCNIPRAMYWLRKVTDKKMIGEAKAVMRQLESIGKKSCAHCHKSADDVTGALKQCSKCKAMWYCSKECQVEAWKMGHRADCNFNLFFGKKLNVMGTRQL